MENQLSHKLLHKLKEQGYTMLVGEEQGELENHVYTPEKWDVEAFLDAAVSTDFEDHAIVKIDDMLKMEDIYLLQHSVILPD